MISLSLAMLMGDTAFGLEKDIIVLGTATPGGGFPVYGAVFSQAVNQVDPTLEIQPRNTKGSIENVSLLEESKLDIALVQGEILNQALLAVGKKPFKLKIIVAMYSTPGMFVVRADSPYNCIQDLVGKPIVFGARGSGLVTLARNILDGIGFDLDRDFKAIYLDRASDGPLMLLEGRAVAMWGGGLGWPGFEAVAAKAPSGARFIAPNQEEIIRILAKHPLLRRMTVPGGSYSGQNSPIFSVGTWSFVLARPDFPEDVAYRLANAVHKAEAVMTAHLPQARETTMANTVMMKPNQDLIHPGVTRYQREIGLSR
jgi:TRAP transporter TAXI family solute receptor